MKLAAEFLILVGGRANEILCATWDEFDLDTATWTVPEHRMKARIEHRVALSDRAVEILEDAKALHRGDGLVFPSPHKQKKLTAQALRQLLVRCGWENVTVHGFRNSIQDWMAEQTPTPYAVAMAVIAHQLKSKSDRAYLRTDYLEQRRCVMQQWADYCGGA